eukprot:1844258-Amphidinium_carterae.4
MKAVDRFNFIPPDLITKTTMKNRGRYAMTFCQKIDSLSLSLSRHSGQVHTVRGKRMKRLKATTSARARLSLSLLCCVSSGGSYVGFLRAFGQFRVFYGCTPAKKRRKC